MFTEDIVNDLKKNFEEFYENAKDAFSKKRYNPAVSDAYKAITILADIKIYQTLGFLPKNHTERFNLLKRNFKPLYNMLLSVFKKYRESYNLRMERKDAKEMIDYVEEFKKAFKVE